MNARSLLLLAVLPLLATLPCPAQDLQFSPDSGALALLLAHSDAVVTVTSAKSSSPVRFGAWAVTEHFKDVVTLAGEWMPEDLTVQFDRGLTQDPTPFKPGQRFILFLKRRHTPTMDVWELSDAFFGCQPYSQELEFCTSAAARDRKAAKLQ